MRPPQPSPTYEQTLQNIPTFSSYFLSVIILDVCKCQLNHFPYFVSIKKIKDEDKNKQTVTLTEYVPNTHQQNPSITI